MSLTVSRPVYIWRWAVFLLAAGYAIRMIVFSDYDEFGGPFRFLTVWALMLSFFCASRMVARSEGRTTRRWDALVGATAVINGMVVLLYWRLYFADPASVTRDGQLGAWWLELYLHALGPALQWIDALFVHRSFRGLKATAAVTVGIVLIYIGWAELAVRPLADAPAGSVTDGLPYPFLNNLVLADRAVFYGVNVGSALVMLLLLFGAARIMRRLPQPAAI